MSGRSPSHGRAGRTPDWLVVGAMKAGTTTIATWLNAHPQAWRSTPKELHYFDVPCSATRDDDWYRQQFAGASVDVVAGEATPAYMYLPDAMCRIGRLAPDARLIVSLRDPVARAYSHYWQRRRRNEEERSFAEAVEADRYRPDGELPGYLARGRYVGQLRRIESTVARDQLLVVMFDDVVERPAETFAAICRHLRIDDTVSPVDSPDARNSYRDYRAPRLYRAMYRHRLWRRIPRRLQPVAYAAFERPTTYPEIDPLVAAELRDWYAEDDEELTEWLGRSLPWR